MVPVTASGTPRAGLRAVLSRAGRELAFCLVTLPFAAVHPAVLFIVVVDLLWSVTGGGRGNPSAAAIVAAAVAQVPLLVLLVSTPAARWLGARQRALAGRLLGVRVAAPPPGRPGPRDTTGWRVVAYQTVKLPLGLAGLYATGLWVTGLVNLAYPLVWGAFRNHPPGARLSPLPVFTPFGWFGDGTFQVATLPGTFAAAATGAAMLFAAPWVTRAVAAADGWLIRALLGPGRLAQRVRDLEMRRARAVDDSAARLRRLERDLHDGAQIRLATVALNLGLARSRLDGVPEARELVDAALRGTREALGELRDLARGLHPPVLDDGLAEALASLTADTPVPVELTVALDARPTPAIESIAYFCAAELLANAAKHSGASRVTVQVRGRRGELVLTVADDGTGGAAPVPDGGLAGLAERVAVVDGRLTVASPAGGPTTVTVELPLSA